MVFTRKKNIPKTRSGNDRRVAVSREYSERCKASPMQTRASSSDQPSTQLQSKTSSTKERNKLKPNTSSFPSPLKTDCKAILTGKVGSPKSNKYGAYKIPDVEIPKSSGRKRGRPHKNVPLHDDKVILAVTTPRNSTEKRKLGRSQKNGSVSVNKGAEHADDDELSLRSGPNCNIDSESTCTSIPPIKRQQGPRKSVSMNDSDKTGCSKVSVRLNMLKGKVTEQPNIEKNETISLKQKRTRNRQTSENSNLQEAIVSVCIDPVLNVPKKAKSGNLNNTCSFNKCDSHVSDNITPGLSIRKRGRPSKTGECDVLFEITPRRTENRKRGRPCKRQTDPTKFSSKVNETEQYDKEGSQINTSGLSSDTDQSATPNMDAGSIKQRVGWVEVTPNKQFMKLKAGESPEIKIIDKDGKVKAARLQLTCWKNQFNKASVSSKDPSVTIFASPSDKVRTWRGNEVVSCVSPNSIKSSIVECERSDPEKDVISVKSGNVANSEMVTCSVHDNDMAEPLMLRKETNKCHNLTGKGKKSFAKENNMAFTDEEIDEHEEEDDISLGGTSDCGQMGEKLRRSKRNSSKSCIDVVRDAYDDHDEMSESCSDYVPEIASGEEWDGSSEEEITENYSRNPSEHNDHSTIKSNLKLSRSAERNNDRLSVTSTEKKIFRCEHCKTSYEKKIKYDEHVKLRKMRVCPVCDADFCQENVWKEHVRAHFEKHVTYSSNNPSNQDDSNRSDNSPSETSHGNYPPSKTPDGNYSPSKTPDGNYSPSKTPDVNYSPSKTSHGNYSPSKTPDGKYSPSKTSDGNNSPSKFSDRNNSSQFPNGNNSTSTCSTSLTEKKLFRCKHCKIVFESKGEVDKHILMRKKRMCPVCEEYYCQAGNWKIHLKSHFDVQYHDLNEQNEEQPTVSETASKEPEETSTVTGQMDAIVVTDSGNVTGGTNDHGYSCDPSGWTKGNFVCKLCSSIHKQPSSLFTHLLKCHSKSSAVPDMVKKLKPVARRKKKTDTEPGKKGNVVMCNECGMLVKGRCFSSHMDHHEVTQKVFICSQCPSETRFTREEDFVSHQQRHGNASIDDPKYVCQWQCLDCSFTHANIRTVARHWTCNHLKSFICQICEKSFPFASTLEYHIISVHGEEKDKKFVCSICGKTFALKGNLKQHMRRHDSKNMPNSFTFRCQFCDKGFLFRGDLVKHEKIHSAIKPFKCSLCGMNFQCKRSMQAHFRSHSTLKEYSCDLCDKKFKRQSNLKEHIFSIHQKEKPYQCTVCLKGFSYRSSLHCHQQVHTGHKKYKCPLCEHLHLNSTHLKRHLQTHVEFICPTCGIDCGNANDLIRHLRRHFGNQALLRDRTIMVNQDGIDNNQTNQTTGNSFSTSKNLGHNLSSMVNQYKGRKSEIERAVDALYLEKDNVGKTPDYLHGNMQIGVASEAATNYGIYPSSGDAINILESSISGQSNSFITIDTTSLDLSSKQYQNQNVVEQVDGEVIIFEEEIIEQDMQSFVHESGSAVLHFVEDQKGATANGNHDDSASNANFTEAQNSPELKGQLSKDTCNMDVSSPLDVSDEEDNTEMSVHVSDVSNEDDNTDHADIQQRRQSSTACDVKEQKEGLPTSGKIDDNGVSDITKSSEQNLAPIEEVSDSILNVENSSGMESDQEAELPAKPAPGFQCDICQKRYSRKQALDFHVITHTNTRPYQCDHCDKSFNHPSTLKRHQETHSDDTGGTDQSLSRRFSFSCSWCRKCFSSKQALQFHITIHNNDRPYKCEICSQGFNHPSTLKRHLENVHDTVSQEHSPVKRRQKECPILGETSGVNEAQVKNNTNEFKPSASSSPTSKVDKGAKKSKTIRYRCPDCGKILSSRKVLEFHLNSHNNIRPFRCDYCLKGFSNPSSCKRHVATHLPKPSGAVADKELHECEICGKGLSSKQTLEYHMNSHNNTRPFLCQTCGKGFNNPITLLRHEVVHTGDKPYQCPICEAKFSSLSGLTRHKRSHVGERNEECTICGQKFLQKSTLKGHMLTHRKTAEFECKVCGKKMKRKNAYIVHMRLHEDRKPLPCRVCGERFNNAASRLRHERTTHFDEKHFCCPLCPEEFDSRSAVMKHLDIHPMKTCALCELDFLATADFVKHLRIHYGNHTFIRRVVELTTDDIDVEMLYVDRVQDITEVII